MKRCVLLLTFFLSFTTLLYAATNPEVARKRMLADLDFIKNSFETKYAPSLWKKDFIGWDAERAYSIAKNKVLRLQQPTIKEYQIILKEFFQSPRDYHVSVAFFSTESAYLPFVVRGADDQNLYKSRRYFIVHVDDAACSLAVGDEILSFNADPIDVAVTKLRQTEIGENTKETDQARAELILTARSGAHGHVVPKGSVDIQVRRKASNRVETVRLNWAYTEEKIRDFTTSKPPLLVSTAPSFEKNSKEQLKTLVNKMMMAPAVFEKGTPLLGRDSGHSVGAIKSFVPPLGKKLWEHDQNFDAYIFTVADKALLPPGKSELRVGYVRIPHYSADEREAEEFLNIISFFQNKTEAVVIDQINNPGGSIFYLYALASMLTDRPLSVPKHRIALTQQEVYVAAVLLAGLEQVKDDYAAKLVFGDTVGGYPVDYKFVVATRAFCSHVIKEWEGGHLYTQPIHLFGVDMIHPHPRARYTKPILLLINELDFSSADFFPAILQDNKRATLLGTRTAGAGGFVLAASYPNLLGIQAFHMTGSLALRDNQQPVENLGVQPDVEYSLTTKDFQENYKPYVEKILKSLCKICTPRITSTF